MKRLEEREVDSAAGTRDRAQRTVAYALILLGIVLRVRVYAFDRSLWLDELFLWSALGDASPMRFVRPLGEGQVAAPGFVLLVQWVRVVFGDSEWALRAPALLAGVVALPLFDVLSRRVLSTIGALFALGLLAVSPQAVYYSAEFKPYALDLVVSIVVLLRALPVVRGERALPALEMTALGLLAVFVSLPAAFLLAGIGITLGVRALRTRDRKLLIRVAGIVLSWLGLFVLQHEALLRHNHADADMLAYWLGESGFSSAPWSDPRAWVFAPQALFRALANPTGLAEVWGRPTITTWAASALFVAGACSLTRNRRPDFSVFAFTIGAALLAAVFRQHPFAGRLLLFLVPALSLMVGAGIDVVAASLPRCGPPVAAVLAAALTFESARGSAQRFARPQEKEETRGVVAALAGRLRPGEIVCLTWYSRFAWRYYAPRFGLDATPRAEAAWFSPDQAVDQVADLAAKAGPAPRVWVFFNHFYPEDDERLRIVDALYRLGARPIPIDGGTGAAGAIEGESAAAFLFDFSGMKGP